MMDCKSVLTIEITPFGGEYSKTESRKKGKEGSGVTFCEGCKKYEQHWFEDRGYCEAQRKPAEATDTACEKFEALDGQTKLEV